MTPEYHATPSSTEDPAAVARSLADQLGHAYARLTPAREGREHHLFRIELPEGERLLKFPRAKPYPDPYDHGRTPSERLLAETYAIQLVRGVGVPDPHVVFDTQPVSAVMGIIPGTTAEIAYERGQLDADSLVAVCLQMGKALGRLHGRTRPDEPDYLPDLPDCDPLSARLLHLDFHLGNVLGRPQLGGQWTITGVVDFTCARWGPIEADFVEMQVSVFALNPRARDAFISGYRQVTARGVDIKDVERRAVREIRRRLVEDPPQDEVMMRRWKDWADTRD
jgi:hypothetical protein